MTCPSCKQTLPDGAFFCSNCGAATLKINLETTVNDSPDTDPVARNPKSNVEPDPRVGVVLDSKYQLLERLGTGGMGSVYRARRLHIGDEVAVKLLSHELVRNDQAIERFRREARAAAMIRHPNVVSIHDFNDAPVGATSEPYIVMELVKGESLRHLLKLEGRLSSQRAVAFMSDICAGVGVAHRQGLLHRDLKPDNVIISPPGPNGEAETAKVVDFGLAKVRDGSVSPLTITGTLLGTAYYMSPEQCRGDELDARTDVYSLAAMLYEMLSGGPPFTATNLTGLITKHLNDPPPKFNEALGIPPALARACYRGLAKRREDRQADAIILGKELQDALSTSLQEIGPQSPAVGAQRPKSNLWKWVIGIGGLSLLAVAVVVVGIAIKLGAERIKQNGDVDRSTQSQTNTNTEQTNANLTTTNNTPNDLRGNWTGTYGPVGEAATLIIKNQTGNQFEGILQQGDTRVAFKGTVESGAIHMKQTAVLNGKGWSLGDDTGTISNDGKRMSGTGKDAMGGSLGINYQWSFSR